MAIWPANILNERWWNISWLCRFGDIGDVFVPRERYSDRPGCTFLGWTSVVMHVTSKSCFVKWWPCTCLEWWSSEVSDKFSLYYNIVSHILYIMQYVSDTIACHVTCASYNFCRAIHGNGGNSLMRKAATLCLCPICWRRWRNRGANDCEMGNS